MTDALAILSAVLLLVMSVWAWRRWGGPAVAVLWLGAGVLVSVLWRREQRPRAADKPAGPTEAERQARRAVAEQLEQGRRKVEAAKRAHEAAIRLEADVHTAGDAEALVDHLIARSKGGR